jgi:tRNA dimethylallyltransferase
MQKNCVIVLGPTAVGKTALAVRIAEFLHSEIISADSRQVYRGLDIGSGKDLCEFTLPAHACFHPCTEPKTIPYHLIDIASLSQEYSVFDYLMDYYKIFPALTSRGLIPVTAGGTGMYLDAVIRGYNLIQVPVNIPLRENLNGKSMEELCKMLKDLKGELHNHTDTDERHRLIRAIEIEVFSSSREAEEQRKSMPPRPFINPIILGTTFPRGMVRERVTIRLRERFKQGMIEEVKALHESGVSYERLERLGLEYRCIARFLQGKIQNEEKLFSELNTAIHQFVKRQETWFRGMERKGVAIHWLKHDGSEKDCSVESRFQQAVQIITEELSAD